MRTSPKNKLLKDRGDVIARTEALNGLRAGRWEGMEQLVESGTVRRDQVTVTWSATMDRRTRDDHRWLHGQKVRMGDFFNPAPGVFMRYPGDLENSPMNPKGLAANTIQCRCWPALRVKSDLMRD
ncbi:phage minor head protein [Paracoccus benzoatiresistens]|uniref:Phage minor head protein n=1 Tax=Paracoccus benzoatiresistens TaxID=2997341 RepID=A0ABT4J9X7_9RHOB|nr:phage minor head protein [Paracoccus sp. EF6]MCZ0963884.1 phage minor head protein [Paracoccus sp. EF6]